MPNNASNAKLAPVMTVGEFHQRFGNDQACLAHLKQVRWGENLENFQCPACWSGSGWWLPNRHLVECRHCHQQTSVTAGTVFHRLRTPLWKWFWALYQIAQDKKGIAALPLAKQVGVCYTTAWLMLHKLRRAMRQRNERYRLQGLVEVDETYTGGIAEGKRGRGAENKTPVAVAVELKPDGKPGRIALAALAHADGHCLKKFAEKNIAKGSSLRTDGWGAYRRVAKAGFEHEPIKTGSGKAAAQAFPWLHTFVSNLKRMIGGTYHHVDRKHLDQYLAEFAFRANRRWREASLFQRIIVAALGSKAVPYRELVAGVT